MVRPITNKRVAPPELSAQEINLICNKARFDKEWGTHYHFLKETYLNDEFDNYTERMSKYLWFIKREVEALK